MMTKASEAASFLWEKPQSSPLQATLDSQAAVLLEQVFDGRPHCSQQDTVKECKENDAHTKAPDVSPLCSLKKSCWAEEDGSRQSNKP